MKTTTALQTLLEKAGMAGVRGNRILRTTSGGHPVHVPSKRSYASLVGKVASDGELLGTGSSTQRKALGQACLDDCPAFDAQDHQEACQAHQTAAEMLSTGNDYQRRAAAMHYVAVVGHKAAALELVNRTPEVQELRQQQRARGIHNRQLAAQAENIPTYLRDLFWLANKRQP